jgi:hypothetical protein
MKGNVQIPQIIIYSKPNPHLGLLENINGKKCDKINLKIIIDLIQALHQILRSHKLL